MLRVHILSKELTYIKLKIVLCSLQDIHEFLDLSPQLPTLVEDLPVRSSAASSKTFTVIPTFTIVTVSIVIMVAIAP